MTEISTKFNHGQIVYVIDPDCDNVAITEARYVGRDDKSGDHLVILDHEEDAVRRIALDCVTSSPDGFKPRLV